MTRKRPGKLSDQLRLLIEDCGVSRYRIAQDTGLDQATLSKFMLGQRGLSMQALDTLGVYLDLVITTRHPPRTRN